MNRPASFSSPCLRRGRARARAFTLIELLVATGMIAMLAVIATGLITVVTRRISNERTRYNLAIQNARAAHVISELARRSTRVLLYPDIGTAMTSVANLNLPPGEMMMGVQPPSAQGDVIAFVLPDGSARFIAFEDTSLNFYVGDSGGRLGGTPITLAGGVPGQMVASTGADAHCVFVQGLPQVSWLAEAQTPLGWTEQITYSAFAVPLHNR